MKDRGEMKKDSTTPNEAAGSREQLTVANAISTDRIKLNLHANDRDGILRELVPLVIDPKDERNTEVLFKALKEREDMCSTCINEGVAVPHSRNALVGLVGRPMLAYGRHRRGVAFGALDGKQVHHFFLLCAPNVREHLQLLARLARLINKPEFRDGLMAAESPDQLMALIKRME
jgi:mannitol/fructose-specific phosphotransferase system IIA component (Ntr-type)